MKLRTTLATIAVALIAANVTNTEAKGRPSSDSVLPLSFVCSDTLKFKAQDMTQQQFISSCDKLAQQETHFHSTLETGYVPVSNDVNNDLLMVIFDDYRQYDRYGYRLFGINTNNGGIYIEGNATDPNNQATFYAHEASWLRPEFQIWNLSHEYVHYLDGRYDLKGNFADYPENTVWWSEGLAEFISLKTNNAEAVALIGNGVVNRDLSMVFNTNYSNTTDEIYRWGYLGVRFMFENYPEQVQSLRLATQNGDWQSYQSLLNDWAQQYESQWQDWLQQLKNS